MISDERLAEIALEIVDAALDIAERLDLAAEQTIGKYPFTGGRLRDASPELWSEGLLSRDNCQTIDTSTLVCHLRVLRDDLPDLTRALRAERERAAALVVEACAAAKASGFDIGTAQFIEHRILHASVPNAALTPDPEQA